MKVRKWPVEFERSELANRLPREGEDGWGAGRIGPHSGTIVVKLA